MQSDNPSSEMRLWVMSRVFVEPSFAMISAAKACGNSRGLRLDHRSRSIRACSGESRSSRFISRSSLRLYPETHSVAAFTQLKFPWPSWVNMTSLAFSMMLKRPVMEAESGIKVRCLPRVGTRAAGVLVTRAGLGLKPIAKGLLRVHDLMGLRSGGPNNVPRLWHY